MHVKTEKLVKCKMIYIPDEYNSFFSTVSNLDSKLWTKQKLNLQSKGDEVKIHVSGVFSFLTQNSQFPSLGKP